MSALRVGQISSTPDRRDHEPLEVGIIFVFSLLGTVQAEILACDRYFCSLSQIIAAVTS